jgi:hypothetical protein
MGALLKKAHHTRIANPKRTPPNSPYATAAGKRTGITNLTKHNNITRAIPGHNLSDFCRVDLLDFPLISIFFFFYLCLLILFSPH